MGFQQLRSSGFTKEWIYNLRPQRNLYTYADSIFIHTCQIVKPWKDKEEISMHIKPKKLTWKGCMISTTWRSGKDKTTETIKKSVIAKGLREEGDK